MMPAGSAIATAVARLESIGVAERRVLVGCTEAEIALLQSESGVCLPSVYVDFLRVMGHSAGGFMVGTDAFFKDLRLLRDAAHQLVRDGECDPLPDKAFVFAGNQGYSFLFFDTLAGDDPPVLRWVEGERHFTRVAASFSDWLLGFIEEYA